MKKIDKNELYENLRGFLKSKGISLDEGSYTQRVQRGCDLLTEAVNATGKTVARAKVKVDKTVDRLRQSIHEATAPEPPAPPKTAAAAKPGKQARTQKKSPPPRARRGGRK